MRARARVRACVRERARACVRACVCVCVCVLDGEGAGCLLVQLYVEVVQTAVYLTGSSDCLTGFR